MLGEIMPSAKDRRSALKNWQINDLEVRVCRALDVAKKALHYFGKDGYSDEYSPIYNFGPEKVIAETAMLMYAASACAGSPGIQGRIDQLAQLLVPYARSERVLVDIALHPALALKFAVPHILLTQLGHDDTNFDTFLKSCLLSQASNGRDRPPSASLERQWIISLWTGEEPGSSWNTNLLNSVLFWSVDILGGLRDDAYAFTHLLMYSMDFGFKPRTLPRSHSSILGEASALLARYMDAEDYDLSGELLLAWPLTGTTWSTAAAFGFRVLARVEDQSGLLPCGNINLGRLNQLKGEERTRYALGMAYHTAYVMGFLCAASLQLGRAPPAQLVGPQFDLSCLSQLKNYLEEDQGHWQLEFASLSEPEQRALTPFILELAIIQKSRKRDFSAIQDLLRLASEFNLDDTPLCRQATELLGCIASCSTVLHLDASKKAIIELSETQL